MFEMLRVEGAERLETWADASTNQRALARCRGCWLQSIDPQRFRPRQEESPGPITIGEGKGEAGQRLANDSAWHLCLIIK